MIGMQAAKAAGMRCIVTKSRYTEGDSFDSADAIFDCIGNAGDERFSLDDLSGPGNEIITPASHRYDHRRAQYLHEETQTAVLV